MSTLKVRDVISSGERGRPSLKRSVTKTYWSGPMQTKDLQAATHQISRISKCRRTPNLSHGVDAFVTFMYP